MIPEVQVTPRSELADRIKALQTRMQKKDIDGALIAQITDRFYFSGTIQQGYLYVPADAPPLLMVSKSLQRAQFESGIENILPLDTPKRIPDLIREQTGRLPGTLGMELDVLPANLYLMFSKLFGTATPKDISPEIRSIRTVKSEYELAKIKKAGQLADCVIDSVKELLEEGIPEIEFAGRMEAKARSLGHQGIIRMRLWGNEIYYGHIMAGDSAAVPSYLASPTGGPGVGPAVGQGSSLRPIGRNEPILVDYVFAYDGYLADNTRIFSIGELPESLLAAHESILTLQSKMKSYIRPGIAAGEIYSMALDWVTDMGYADFFMGSGPDRIRFVGHGVGLELDEYPILAQGQDMVLEENMVLAIEPKYIFPGKGVVGIENTHILTADGLIQVTCSEEKITLF